MPNVDYLVVAGGGTGGNPNWSDHSHRGGGGGGGGMLEGIKNITASGLYQVVVGASDTNSSFGDIVATAGGHGGNAINGAGGTGGSGGGGSADSGAAGSGTVGQGNNGGPGPGGGGGAGAVGTGSKGAGKLATVFGGTYAAGGEPGGTDPAAIGAANTGNGGQGGDVYFDDAEETTIDVPQGAGGSGIVKLRYLAAEMTATGGTISDSGAYKIHSFTSSGTFTATVIGSGNGFFF